MTDALFEPPEPEPLTLPARPLDAAGDIRYTRYNPLHPDRCGDCVMVLYEANKAGTTAPAARQARWKRRQGRHDLLLCAEHKQLREREELELAVLREIEQHRR